MQHQTAIKPLTIIAIMLMVFSVSAMALVDFEESDALSAYSGGSNRSSASDPYSSIVIDAADFRTGNTTIYVERGGSVSVTNDSNVGNLDVNAGMGIVDNGQTLSGSLSPRSSSNTVAYIYLDNVVRLTVNIVDPEPETTPVTSVTVSGSSSAEVGDRLRYTASILPSDADDKSVRWTASPSSRATFSSATSTSPYVTFNSAGSVTLTCTAQDGSGKSDSITVQVTEPANLVESVEITCVDTVFYVGEQYTFDAEITPSDADDDSVTWSVTSGSSLVTVDRTTDTYIRITCNSPGSVTIEAEANDESGEWDEFTFTIVNPEQDFVLKYEMDGGSPQLSQQSSTSSNDTVRFVINATVPIKTGYNFQGWKASDGTIYQPGSDFYAVPGTNILTAQWELITYTANLVYSADGASNVPDNDRYTGSSTSDHTFTIDSKVPTKPGYIFLYWSCEGERYNPGGTIDVPYNGTKTLTAMWDVAQLEITSTQNSVGMIVNEQFSYTVTTSHEGCTVSVSGADWLSVSGNVISGTPTETGPYDVTVTIHKDGGYTDDTQSFKITVYSKAGFVSEPGADGFYTYMLD